MATIDLSVIPGNVQLKNSGTKTIKINISGFNQSFPIPAGDTLILKAQSSSELIGYLSQESEIEGLEVTLPTAPVGG